MKKIALYLRLQYKFITLLFIFLVVPYYLNFRFDFNIPYLISFFIIGLFCLKIFVIKSNASSKSNLAKAKKSLPASASKQMIINRAGDLQNSYDFALMLTGLFIIFIGIFNNGF